MHLTTDDAELAIISSNREFVFILRPKQQQKTCNNNNAVLIMSPSIQYIHIYKFNNVPISLFPYIHMQPTDDLCAKLVVEVVTRIPNFFFSSHSRPVYFEWKVNFSFMLLSCIYLSGQLSPDCEWFVFLLDVIYLRHHQNRAHLAKTEKEMIQTFQNKPIRQLYCCCCMLCMTYFLCLWARAHFGTKLVVYQTRHTSENDVPFRRRTFFSEMGRYCRYIN